MSLLCQVRVVLRQALTQTCISGF